MMELKNIIFEKKDFLAWITLNRPEVRNAQNDAVRAEITWALENSRDDDNVRIIIITGAGDKAFSAGADISEFPKRTPADILRGKGIKRMTDLLREIPKPAIAMVNGLALGGGCELAMACDIIVASENAMFGQPEINVGVIPGAGGTQVLPRLVGEKKAKELVFTGSFIAAQEALALGLINKVVPQEKLREAVMEMAKAILRHSPIILKLCKLAINKSLDVPLTVGMDYERDLFAMCFGTEDQKEGSKAFLEKRKPEYKGR
jgi:enoyl-CoA hydratase